MLPKGIGEIIKEHNLFGYDPNKVLEKVEEWGYKRLHKV
jgi:hypothetical protein